MYPLANAFLIAGLLFLTIVLLVYGAGVLIPLAIALLFWFFINALAKTFQRLVSAMFHLPRSMSLILALATILALSLFTAELVITNVSAIGSNPVDFEKTLNPLINKVAALFGVSGNEFINLFLDEMGIEKLLGAMVSAMAGLAGQLGIVFVYVIFLLVEQQFFDVKLNAIVKNEERRAQVRAMLDRVGRDIQSYLWIMTLVSLLTAVLSYAVMLVIGLDHAEFWGFMIFVLNFIPTIGSIIGTAFPALYALLQFGDFTHFLTVLAAVGLIQFVIGNVVQPRMAAKTLNLSQFVVILSLFIWGAVWGVVGMFLAVPITSILMIVLSNFKVTQPAAQILSQDGRTGTAEKTL